MRLFRISLVFCKMCDQYEWTPIKQLTNIHWPMWVRDIPATPDERQPGTGPQSPTKARE
jgi:hypothetical protein